MRAARGNGRGRSGQRGRQQEQLTRGCVTGRLCGRGREQNVNSAAIHQKAPATPSSPWANSRAKKILRGLLLDPKSDVHIHRVEEIHSSNPLFEQYPLKNFKINFKNLKESIDTEQAAIKFDQLALDKEKQAFPRNDLSNKGYPFWDTHPAKTLLEADVKRGITKKPSELQNSKEAYKAFPPVVFRKHVHQEIRKQREKVAWQTRRNKEGRTKHELEQKIEAARPKTVANASAGDQSDTAVAAFHETL